MLHQAPDYFFFVDGFAAGGLYHFEDRDEFVLGSTPIALRTVPNFARVVSIELDHSTAENLRTRTSAFGPRSVVIEGDCNRILLESMEREIPRDAPTLVFLDPTGEQLEWSTVAAVSQFKSRGTKPELLILVATGWLGRAIEAQHDPETDGANRTSFVFPRRSAWMSIWEQRRRREISASQCRTALAEDYRRGLVDELGYQTAFARPITRGGTDDSSVYHLLFATDHAAGQRIMESAFKRMYANVGGRAAQSARHPTQASMFDSLP